MVLLVPASHLAITTIQNNVVAVPVLAAVKVFADHSSRHSRLAAVLGE